MADSELYSGTPARLNGYRELYATLLNKAIIEKYQSGNYDIPALAKLFNLSERHMYHILIQNEQVVLSCCRKSFVARILATLKWIRPQRKTAASHPQGSCCQCESTQAGRRH